MTKNQLQQEAMLLTPGERLDLAVALWESVEGEARQPALSARQRELLLERIAEDDESPNEGAPWLEVKRKILAAL